MTHFEILEQIGSGGMGVVYRGRDVALGRPVALKIITAERNTDPDRIRRFLREARAASALNHPNIVTVYEVEKTEEGLDFIAMEYVEGETLRAVIRRSPPLETVVPVVRQIAAALQASHAQGIVHRDIKPENVVLRNDGYIKVLDFGLALLPDFGEETVASRATHPGSVVGTISYLAPEQARGEPATAASDIFALGIVFHELITGTHPFESTTPFATAYAIMSEPPVLPSHVVPGIPQEIEALILRMLEKRPERRPTAADVVEFLGNPTAVVSGPRPAIASSRRVVVGRDVERAELLRCLGNAGGGHGSFAFVSGEPGIGKTTLVESFLAESAPDSLAIGIGRCSERLAASEGYLPLLEAFDGLMRGPDGPQAAKLMRLFAPSWYSQLRSPSRASAANALEHERGAPLERMKRELAAFLEEYSSSAPLVLFFDDLHWADLSTLDMVSHVAGRVSSMRLLVIGTFRPADLALERHPFLEVKLDLVAKGLAREFPLGFLSVGDIDEYLGHNFPGHNFPREFTELVRRRTEGNPLFMAELLRDLRDDGVLVPEAGGRGWRLSREVHEIAVRLPESVRSLIDRKIQRLSEDNRRLLATAAIQGYAFESAVLARALALDPADVEERLHEMESMHGFVRQSSEHIMPGGAFSLGYAFVHALYQDAFLNLLRPTRRAILNGAVGQALLDLYGPRHHEIAAELGLLFEAARQPARAVEHCLVAARQAAEISAHSEAIALGQRGLRLLESLPESPERLKAEAGLYLTLGTSLVMTRGYADAEAERTYSKALELCRRSGSPGELFLALLGVTVFYLFRPRLHTALEIAEQAVRFAEETGDLELLVWAHTMHGNVLSHIGRFREALSSIETACSYFERNPAFTHISRAVHDPGPLAHGQAARLRWICGFPDQSLAHARRALDAARARKHDHTLAMALFFSAWIHQYRREPEDAQRLASEAGRLAETRGFVNLLPWVGSIHGWARVRLGQQIEGIAEMKHSLAVLQRIGAGLMTPQFAAMLAEALAGYQDPNEALALLERAAAETTDSGERYFDAEILRIKAEVVRKTRSGSDSEPILRQALELSRESGALSFELRAATALARLQRERGKAAGGLDELAEVYGRFTEGFDTPDLVEAAALLEARHAD